MIQREALSIGIKLTVLDCATCGVVYGITDQLESRRRDDGGNWYCPNGHSQVFTKSATQELAETKKRLQEERERALALRAEVDQAWQTAQERANELKTERRRSGQLKRRISAGVCPHCKRTVKQMAQHIATCHPQERAEALVADPVGAR